MILLENALEAWASAIYYCDEIMDGKSTLKNKKNFVDSLQNAIELFTKQIMLNRNDYRVAKVKKIDQHGEPLRSYLNANELNEFFKNIVGTEAMKDFITMEFSNIIDIHTELFRDFLNKEQISSLKTALKILKDHRNNETHFYISGKDFLSEHDFQSLYNLMCEFYKLLEHYELLPFWGEAFGEFIKFDFTNSPLQDFSYKRQLEKSKFVKDLNDSISKCIYPVGSNDGAYYIAQNIIQTGESYSEKDFSELWEYIQALCDQKMLEIDEVVCEYELEDGSKDVQLYSTYNIIF